MTVYIARYNDKIPSDSLAINTTSRAKKWAKNLSPFFLGPVDLYDGHVAKNVENAWQFSKVYYNHLNDNGDPSEEYWEWAKEGWSDSWAHRYPIGKGAVPEYSYWDGEKLGYIEARKKIYIPLYSKAVKNTYAFKKLQELSNNDKDIYLIDFDGYNNKKIGMSYDDVINCKKRKMGHAFVLGMMLDEYLK